MSGRNAALVGVLLFVALLAILTVDVMLESGIDVLVIVSLFILAMVAYGTIGALFTPPED
jgi:hypothetical protein